MNSLELRKSHKMFDGEVRAYTHYSDCCQSKMNFTVFIPPHNKINPETKKFPAIYCLSGLTCTDENFTTKAGAQKYAAREGIFLIMPDTSPRNLGLPNENDSYDLGSGASFYINATQEPWKKHYQVESYITEELPLLIEKEFQVEPNLKSILGHSMGGHGALSIALKFPKRYRSASAFSPIAAPTQCPWGQKAFQAYLGSNHEEWKNHDTCELILKSQNQIYRLPLLVDQGSHDEFLKTQLLPEKLQQIAKQTNYPLTFRLQEGYDHSYFFIASFIEEHINFHAEFLK